MRDGRLLPLVTLALVLALASPAPAEAMRFREGDRVTVPDGETIRDDLYVAGSDIEIAGDVRGDLIAAGQDVVVTGRVSGDVIAAGESVRVLGTVGGSVRAAGRTVVIEGRVREDVVAAGQDVSVSSAAKVGRDFAVGGSDVTIDGGVARNVWVGAENARIAGDVGGNAYAEVGDLVVDSDARVSGDLTYRARDDASVSSGSVEGRIRREPWRQRQMSPVVGVLAAFLAWVRALVGLFLFGLIAVLLFPRFAHRSSEEISASPLASLGLGAAVVFATPVAAMFLFVAGLLIGGWWIALMLLALYWILLVLGYVLGAVWLGRMLVGLLRPSRIALPLALIVGLVVLSVVTLLPYLGWLVGLAVVLFGTGAAVLAVVRRGRPAETAPVQPTP